MDEYESEKATIEQWLNHDLTQCPTIGVPFLIGDSVATKKRTITKARCKQWDCQYCAGINKSNHMNRIALGIDKLMKDEVPLQFVTITCHEKWRGYEASVRNWRRNKDKLLARFRRSIKKLPGSACAYVYIPECHKDGSIHIHGVFTGQNDTRWWKDHARASGLGYMAESKQLESALQAINYMLKYITKEIGKPNVTKGFRRINYSQAFPDVRRIPSSLEWRVLSSTESIEDAIKEGLYKKGFSVEFEKNQWDSSDDFL